MKTPDSFFTPPQIPQQLLQGMADLGYPKGAWQKMGQEEIQNIVNNQIRYQPTSLAETVSEPEKEDFSYTGEAQHQAAYSLDLDILEHFDYEQLESKDAQGETPTHLVVMMAFRDFEKAERIIAFFKKKGIEMNEKNNDGLTPLEIAKRRATITPAYARIVSALSKESI